MKVFYTFADENQNFQTTMNVILFILGIIIIFWIHSKINKRIDDQEAKDLATPGRADYIRDNYADVVLFLESLPKSTILFERRDQIRIAVYNKNEYFAIYSYSGGLLIAHVKWSAVQKEWKFSRGENSKHIIYTISSYLNLQ